MKEAVLEFFRTTILSTVASVITIVVTGINTQTGTIQINWGLAVAVGMTTLLTGILRFIDKYGYENDTKLKMPF